MMLPWQHIPRQQLQCRGPSTNSAASVKTLASLNQPQENQCEHECPGCQPSPWNQNRRPHFRFNHLHMNSSFDSEISRRISKAPAPCPNWKKRAWKTKYLTENTKMYIYMYQACVLSTLLCGSELNLDHLNETERRLNSFHLRCLTLILGVKWQDYITNSEISPACPPFAASAAWDGSDMFIAWMMDASPRKFYSDNWKQE